MAEVLNLPKEKVGKDVELYRSNLEKLRQAQEVLADVLKADRKKQQEREDALNQDTESDAKPDESEAPEEEDKTESLDDEAIASSDT